VCFDFPDYGLYYRCTSDVVATDVGIRIRYVSGRDIVTLDGQLSSAAFTGRWTGLGVDANFRLDRSGTSSEPLVEENVKFRNGDVELAGTIVRPAAKRRYPAVVWTHGSGNQRRSEDFYRDRGYLLAEHGLAALIYDKRGVGDSGGDPESTLDELAGDAVAAVQFLRRREEIDPDAVGVGGFSQGGYVAPLAAVRYGRIAFVVTGAAPGVTPAEQNDFAALTALTRRGLPADAIERAMALRRDVLHAQETGSRLAAVNQELADAQTEAWFRAADLPATVQSYGRRGLSVLQFDPHPVWTRVEVPVLAIWGEDDALVPVEQSKQSIQSWLNAAGNRDVTLLVYPGAGHGLALTGRAGVWDWPRLAPGFHDAMLKWIAAHVSSAGSR
jgi:pimeloyl-ACP methyl ester carboxylesterase